MSFDLYFCRQNSPNPSIAELKDYFAASPSFQVDDTTGDGVEFNYVNEATGVYCQFSYSPLDAAELEECGSSGLTFNLSFNRASFFAYETMPLVEAFCKKFDLIVEDPQAETVGPADANRLIASWRNSNARATTAIAKENVELHYLPERSATEWWRYVSVSQSLDEAMTEDVFIPTPLILMNAEKKLFTMTIWPDGIAEFFPTSDYVLVQREKKRLFGTKKESGVIDYEQLIEAIGHLLTDYDFRGLRLKYLRPEDKPQAAPLVQKLPLEPIELARCTRMAPDSFHDVAL